MAGCECVWINIDYVKVYLYPPNLLINIGESPNWFLGAKTKVTEYELSGVPVSPVLSL